MLCPICNKKTAVIDSRKVNNENFLWRRRRACPFCGHRFTTYECRKGDKRSAVYLAEKKSNTISCI